MLLRRASRLILLDETDRLLLFQVEATLGRGATPSAFWITPGGGLEGGETHEEAARRKLREETGLVIAEPGEWVWTREADIIWNGIAMHVHERFYVVRVAEPHIHFRNLGADAWQDYRAHKWWSPGELQNAHERFIPEDLARLVPAVARGDLPVSPLLIG